MPLGEFELIARYFAQQPSRADVRLGIGDDAAVLDARGDRKLVVAIDTIVAGVHFPEGLSAADIGYRALAVNLSDLAAMGAQPSWFTLSLSMPDSDEHWIEDFARGMFELAHEHDVILVGGDTVKGPLVATVQIAGWVEADRWLTRDGARPGDALMVSSMLGEAAGGLAAIQRGLDGTPEVARLRQRFLRPTPRVMLGRQLRQCATAAMDISDGLLADLDKLCSASRCGAQVDVEAIPRSPDLAATFDEATCLDFALSGGDDYELLFTVPEEQVPQLTQLGCLRIGTITADRQVICRRNGEIYRPERRGFDHFSEDRAR
jgi:thiamine-monophosphate kinase